MVNGVPKYDAHSAESFSRRFYEFNNVEWRISSEHGVEFLDVLTIHRKLPFHHRDGIKNGFIELSQYKGQICDLSICHLCDKVTCPVNVEAVVKFSEFNHRMVNIQDFYVDLWTYDFIGYGSGVPLKMLYGADTKNDYTKGLAANLIKMGVQLEMCLNPETDGKIS